MRYTLLLLLPLAFAASPVAAQDLRDFCAQRPGLGTAACILDRGHLQIESGLGDWTLDRQPDSRTDTIAAGDAVLRYGLTGSLEAQLGWTAFGHVRERDRLTGDVTRRSGIGDVSVALKQGVLHPDGHGLAIALLPFVTLPVGRAGIGAGDWGAGLLVPVTYDLSEAIQLEFTPEIDAAVDQDGDGRHLAFSGVIGATDKLGETLSATIEYQALRDRDPSGHQTQHLAGLSVGWLLQDAVQLDVGANAGLSHAAPDVELYFGISRRF